jgi:aryl-alcohol dehydrogenase-like predicted oxidoreductase
MRLGLGTVQFGLPYGIKNTAGRVPPDEVRRILRLASLSGVEVIDTAIAYGESETCLGSIGVESFKVVTKIPPLPDKVDNIDSWVRNQLSASLARLGLERAYGLLLHRAEDLNGPFGEALGNVLHALRTEGLVEKVGVSVYETEQLDIHKHSCKVDLVQAPLNLLDQRLVTSGWLNRLHDEGVEVHTRSTFLQGLLLMSRGEIPEWFDRWPTVWDAWHDWLADSNIPAAQACMQYPLSFPQISAVLVGVTSIQEFSALIHMATYETTTVTLPELGSIDSDLINPSNWNKPRS